METYDPLAAYRKKPPAPASVVNPPQGGAEYIAYGTKDKVRRLRIRPATTATHSPGYNLLLDISYDGDHGTNIMLIFTVMMVMVQGKNLQKLVFALENDMAEYIQEFDPDKWAKPTDANAAVIESIKVKVTEGNGASGEAKH
jgi:hypothetical protein